MKKNTSIMIGAIVVIVLIVGGFFVFHKSSKPTSTASTTTKTSTTPAVNNAILATKTDATLGQYLANPSGMALYTYSGDTAGVSNCTGSCLSAWPAYVQTSSTTSLPTGVTTITRSDNGQTQYAYNGMPLYTFESDSAGKVTGNGVNGFSVAVPAAASASSSSSSSADNSSSSAADNSSSSNPYNY